MRSRTFEEMYSGKRKSKNPTTFYSRDDTYLGKKQPPSGKIRQRNKFGPAQRFTPYVEENTREIQKYRDMCIYDNCPIYDTPKSDLWDITKINTAQISILERTYSHSYIQKVEKLFAETILSTNRDIRTYNRFINNLYYLLFSECILSLVEVVFPIDDDSETMTAGGTNQILNDELAFESVDSQHDLKPGRNKLYPIQIDGMGVIKEAGNIVYSKLNDVIGSSPNLGNAYIVRSPIAFEEDIKVDYLLGELAGPLEDIYYYFTDVGAMPPNWTKSRKTFFNIQPNVDNGKVNHINALVIDVNERDYKGWILDACISGRVSSALGNRIKTLANIWDPVKGTFKMDDLVDCNADINDGKLTPEEIKNAAVDGYRIYDCKINTNGESLYDMVYYKLLNNRLIDDGYNEYFNIKLRLAVSNNPLLNQQCSVVIMITSGAIIRYFVISSGFSVVELTQGMRYIDDKYKYRGDVSDQRKYTGPMNMELRGIIDYLDDEVFNQLQPDIRSKIIQKMLYRFKSSGDHGTSDTVKVLNAVGLNYLFLSGDNLAYVYAMSSIGNGVIANGDLPTPTVGRYYFDSSKKTGEEEEDEEDSPQPPGTHTIDGNHFIVAYFPSGDDLNKNYIKLLENLSSLYGLSIVTGQTLDQSITPNYLSGMYTELTTYISNINTNLLAYIKQEQSGFLDPDTITRNFTERINTIIRDIIGNHPVLIYLGTLPSVETLSNILQREISIEQIKVLSKLLNVLTNALYFMHKYSYIVKLSGDMIEADRKAFTPIIRLDQPLSGRPSRMGIKTALTLAYSTIKKNLSASINLIRPNLPDTTTTLTNELKSTVVSNTRTEYDTISGIKKTLLENSKMLFSRMKRELGFSDAFLNAMKNEILKINDPFVEKLKADIITGGGGDDFARGLVDLFKNELKNKISQNINETTDIIFEPYDGPLLDVSDATIDNNNNPNIRVIDPDIITTDSKNLLLTIPIAPAKKKIITIIKNGLTGIASSAATVARSAFSTGVRGGKSRNNRRRHSHNFKRHTKKHSRVRKTRKNTKRPKYIKKHVTRRRR